MGASFWPLAEMLAFRHFFPSNKTICYAYFYLKVVVNCCFQRARALFWVKLRSGLSYRSSLTFCGTLRIFSGT